jgi:YidC/Oxa1 family membrane protein insertase
MDRKSIIIVALCVVLIISWGPLTKWLWPTPPPSINPTNQVAMASGGTNQAVTTNATITTGTSNAPATFVVHPEIHEDLLVITNNNGRYTFTSRGGGLKEVELVGYPESTSSRRKLDRATNQWATLNNPAVPPVFALAGDESLQGDNVFKLTPIPNGVRAEKTLPNGLTITKDFQLSTNFLVTASIKLENRSQQPLGIPSYQWIAGTATPMGPQDNGLAESVVWYNGSKTETVALPYFNTNTSSFLGLFARTPKTEYVAGSSNVVWSSAQNQFFTLAAMPDKPASTLLVHMVDLPPLSAEEIKEYPNAIRNPKGLETRLIYPGLSLPPGAAVTNQFNLFAGPKEYQTLARIATRFNNDIDQVMGFGWSWTSPISKALLVTMNWLHHSLGLPYGWLIILITVVIKFVFWPLTQASVRSAKRMQALQPQLKALQEKYKDDPQKFTAKQWEFYKKNKVNPLSGCLPMLLQVPVFIGFYGMLRTAIELRGAPFLWIGDLSKPDTIYSLYLPFRYFGFSDAYFPINPMPLIMGVTLLFQARLQPVSPGMDPSQQKMMKYMPLMMLLFMYNLSSGLALYWTVNNLLTIVQTKLTRTQTGPAVAEPVKTAAPMAPQRKKK